VRDPVGDGDLACGDEGPGRLIELETIVDYVNSHQHPETTGAQKSAHFFGPTWEPIDPVRGITNRSSGKMGAALAAGPGLAGAQVTVVSGPGGAMLPGAVRSFVLRPPCEMLTSMEQEFANADICIMAAAVADFRPGEIPVRKKTPRSKRPVEYRTYFQSRHRRSHLGRNKNGPVSGWFFPGNDETAMRGQLEKIEKRKNCDMMGCRMIVVETSLGRRFPL